MLTLPEGMTAEEAQAILAVANEEKTYRRKKDDEWVRVCVDDEALKVWASRNFRFWAIGRANYYNVVNSHQECYFGYDYSECDFYKNRPVVMRGSIHYLILKHSGFNNNCANGWCMSVLERWVRMKRFTFLKDEKEIVDIVRGACNVLSKRHRTTYHLYRDIVWNFMGYYLNGRRVSLNETQRQHIMMLKDIINKFDRLDDRKNELTRRLNAKLYI